MLCISTPLHVMGDSCDCTAVAHFAITSGALSYSTLWHQQHDGFEVTLAYNMHITLCACKMTDSYAYAELNIDAPSNSSLGSLQVLYLKGVVASPRATVAAGDATICHEPGVCFWYWHSQPARDKSNKPSASRIQGLQGSWTAISRLILAAKL